jgi:imidazolonepropionase-like amidohydrolase
MEVRARATRAAGVPERTDGRLAICLALACALAPGAVRTPAARAETIVLAGGTVHPVSGPAIENGMVVMRDGKITAVGTRLDVPPGATVVSCDGRHVYPGLISPLSVLGLTEVGSVTGTNDWQEIGNYNPNVRAEVQINPESELLPVTRVNGITSALIVPRGGAIAGTSALVHLDGWTEEDMTVRAPVGLHVIWPAMSPVRAWWETRSEEEQRRTRDATIDSLKRAFDDARAYWTARAAEGKQGVPRHDRDVRWEAMGRALKGEIPVLIHASALNQIRAALRFVDEQRLPKVVLVGGDDAWRVADEIKRRDIAVICSGTLELPSRRDGPYDEAFALPAKLAAAGVRFCISDGGGPFTAPNARNLPYHAAMAAAFGLPKEEALKGVTLYVAQILGLGDRLGTLEPGKIADVIVTNGDPLEIATTVEQVYIAGRATSMETRHTRLFQKYDARPRGPKARKTTMRPAGG